MGQGSGFENRHEMISSYCKVNVDKKYSSEHLFIAKSIRTPLRKRSHAFFRYIAWRLSVVDVFP